VKVGLVVAGLLSIDPPLVLPSLFHGVQRTLRGGSFREPPGNQIASVTFPVGRGVFRGVADLHLEPY
jgi:hypothetical protein